jgi:hypothetical protein
MELRIRNTGQVVQEAEFRRLHNQTSFPPQLSVELINDFGADVVFEGPAASNLEFWQFSQRDGVEQINGKWYSKYIAGPVFDTQVEQDEYVAQKTTERMVALQASIVQQTQARLDTFAQTRNYAGIMSACTYVASTVPKFATEGSYCVAARDETWATLYQILADVQAGTRPVPTSYAEIEPELPVLAWPN